MSTVRFAQLVARAGKPREYTLWGPPERDPEFQKAVESNRVLTIHQNNIGHKKDFASVGFLPDGPAQFLVFPKPLKAFEGRKVVGIQYEILEPPASVPAPAAVAQADRSRAQAAGRRRSAERGDPRRSSSKGPPVQPSPPEPPVAPARPMEPVRRGDGRTAQGSDITAASAEERGSTETRPALEPASVIKEIRAALDELENDKTVKAFKRLSSLAERLERSPG